MGASRYKVRYDRARSDDGPRRPFPPSRDSWSASGRDTQFTAESITQEETVKANARVGFVACTALLLLAALSACAPKSPEERVAAARGSYRATLNGFVVQEEVVGAGETVEGGEMEPAATEEPVAEGEEMPEPEVIQNVLVDILVQHDSYELLSGVTVEIWQVDASEETKGHWQLWVDTEGLPKATATQVGHVLEDVSYEDGDGFAAEIRLVPEGERGDYREYSEAGP